MRVPSDLLKTNYLRMKTLFTLLLSILTCTEVLTAQQALTPDVIELYPKGQIPLAKPCAATEIIETSAEGKIVRVSQVQTPRLEFWKNRIGNSRQAVLLIPGGGYGFVSVHNEGLQMAEALLPHAFDVFSLIYRLPIDTCQTDKKWVPLLDAMRALEIIWQRGYEQVYVIGFSAGGHLAASLATLSNNNPHYKSVKQASAYCLVYPVISLQHYPHVGSHARLLGPTPLSAETQFFSLETQVSSSTPPCILVHAVDDKGVAWQNSDVYFKACQDKGVYSSLLLFPKGGHGFGIGRLKKSDAPEWIPLALDFFQSVK
jgi:acetyl esterase/lipase